MRHVIAAVVLFASMWAAPASAQPSQRFEAGVQAVAASMPAFEGSDFGIGGRLAWRTDDVLSFEAAIPAVGASTPAQLAALLAAEQVELSADERRWLESGA